MNKTQLKKFKKLLETKRAEIVKKAQQTLEQDMALDADDLPDEMDLASSEYLQAFTFRLRGREKTFLDKIQKALERIEDGTFGTCEECGEPISVKRLEARPETTLCIRCKEDKARRRDFGARSASRRPCTRVSVQRLWRCRGTVPFEHRLQVMPV
jgi:DnaK suppressor protein